MLQVVLLWIFISIKITSISDGRFSIFNNFEVILVLKYTKIPQPWAFLSWQWGKKNPSIMKCASENDSSIFVSENIRISISEVTSDSNISNLFCIELSYYKILGIFQAWCFQTIDYIIAVFCCYFWGINFIIFPLVLNFNLKSISLNIRQKFR